MKKIVLFFIGLLISILSYSQTYNFTKPTLTKVGEYTVVEQKVCNNYGLPGDPFLPYYLEKTGLKSNQTLNSIDVLSVEYYPTETNIKIQFKDSEFVNPSFYKPAKPSIIYSATKYPLNIIKKIDNDNFTICPVVYYPNKNEAKFIKSITLKKNVTTLKTLKSAPASTIIYEPVDLLIITKYAFADKFNTLCKYKQGQGYYTKIIPVETIYENYEGVDKQDQIRNCIKYYYQYNGLKYVILGGTSLPSLPNRDVIPHRGFYGSYDPPDCDIPADIYYANLDGIWKGVNDSCYGQTNEDFTTEVIVARLPVIDTNNINDITAKLIKYQETPVTADLMKTAMVGEALWPASNIYGYNEMENLITSVPMPSRFNITKLYDSVNIDNINEDTILYLYNNLGIHMYNHLGHSGGQSNMGLSSTNYINTWDMKFLYNDGINKTYGIIYSQGCYAGALDMRDGRGIYYAEEPWMLHCVSGAAVVGHNGCVAYMANTRYGFYDFNHNGSSQKYHREYLKSLFTKDITQIGDAFYDAKSVIAPFINQPTSGSNIKWTYYAMNLWADPTMYVWTKIPTDIIATYPTSVLSTATSITITTNTPNARVALLMNDILIGRGMSDVNGSITIPITIAITGTLNLSIIGANKNRFRGNINVIQNSGSIRGTVYYGNTANTVLGDVIVNLYKNNVLVSSTTTMSNGTYIFDNVVYGTYTLKVVCNKTVGGINSADAQLIQQHYVGMKKLTGVYLLAADVTGEGAINTLDAQTVSRYFAGYITSFKAGTWVFESKTVTLNSFNKVATIKGLCYGDVNGSFIP